MSFQRPTLNQLIDRIKTDAESRYGQRVLRRSLITVFSRVFAGAAYSLYGYIEYVSKQIFATTAEGPYLERRASEYGIYRKKATAAEGTVTFSGSSSATSGGSDTENDESLRSRLLFRMRNPPKAGTRTDYVAWALEVPGVTRAWCYPLELGPGHVSVRFMTDGLTNTGIPSSVMVERVKNHIEALMPVTTILTVVAPNPKSLNMTLDITPDSPEIRAKVESAAQSVIRAEAEPATKVLLTTLNRAVASVEEIKSFRIVSPTDDVNAATGEILIPGTITYQ